LLGLAALAVLAATSIKEAVERVATFPEHRGYRAPEGFVQYDIGGIERIDRSLLDPQGVSLYDYGGPLGKRHNPLFVADFVLSLVPYAEHPEGRRLILANLSWLESIAEPTPGGNLLFHYGFDFAPVGETAPWVSAMAQARIGQAMLWGFRLFREPRYLETGRRAILAIREGAPGQVLAKPLSKGVWLKEFPRYPFHVLDGSLVAVVGVREVLEGLPEDDPGRPPIGALLAQSIEGFVANYRCFTTPAGGLLFADNGKLPTQAYYDIVMDQLAYLAPVEPAVGPIARAYSIEGLPYWRRLALYYWYRLHKTALGLGLAGPCVR
jgi:hypothetical protein